jgi:Lipocalin-like domain
VLNHDIALGHYLRTFSGCLGSSHGWLDGRILCPNVFPVVAVVPRSCVNRNAESSLVLERGIASGQEAEGTSRGRYRRDPNETGAGGFEALLPTVSSVDLTRYVGKWYEIARYPNWFEKEDIGDVTAEYTPLGQLRGLVRGRGGFVGPIYQARFNTEFQTRG